MKKKGMISFIILFSIFFGPMVVEAKTECQYVLDREDFIPVTFVLETEDDDSKLTKVTLFADTSVDMGDPKFANGEGLDLNDDGTCPNIVVYDQRVMGGYKIYKTMNSCHDGWLTSNNNCFELSGTVRDSSSSESDQTGAGVQFRLTDSTDSSCSYERVYDMYNNNQRVDTITINSGNNNSLSGTCDVYLSTSCRVAIDVQDRFYSNNTFTCPEYIYARIEAGGRDLTNYTYTIYDVGGESDEDRSGPENNEQDWEELGDALTTENFNQPIGCDDIFSQEEGDLGWLLNLILGYIRVIGPILVVLLSAIDFIKAVLGTDEKAMKEAQSKLVIRLICAVALFLVPTLVQVLLSFINQTVCSL